MTRFGHLLVVAGLALSGASACPECGMGNTPADKIEVQNEQSLFWGPYKPNLYFGVRPRVPEGLWTGLLWGGVNTFEEVPQNFRYTCEQGGDIHGYGWDEYDARTGGVQSIHDDGNKIDMTTSWVKIPGGDHGGNWAARIKGQLQDGAPLTTKTNVFYYFAQEGDASENGATITVEGTGGEFGFEGDIKLKGTSDELGDYTIVVTKGEGKHPTSKHSISESRRGDTTLVRSVEAAAEIQWQAKAVLFMQMREAVEQVQQTVDPEDPPPPWQVYRLPHRPAPGNVHIVQKTFEGSFEFDVIFSSLSAGKEVTPEDVTRELQETKSSFTKRFGEIFDLKAPFTAEEYQTFGKSMFSNLLGGVGYFYGKQVIDRSYAEEYEEEDERFWEAAAEARSRKQQALEGPYQLYTSVPSRPFFPRGFLWDEGFHLIAIADWDIDLTLNIVKSWYNTMDNNGWIPREQILGEEARSKVPAEFQVQYPHYANPPTLFLIIESFMDRLRAANATHTASGSSDDPRTAHLNNPEVGEEFLRKMYPLLRRQYDWFRKTQRGEIKMYDREAYSSKEAYRWRGRTETHILTSGIDDYPRPQPPHPGELHVDLLAWVGLMSKSLIRIADALGNEEDVAELTRNLNALEHNMNDLHWSEKEGTYCDATIDDFEEHALVCHKGYISLMPFLVGLLKPDDPKLGRTLDLIADEDQLWSPHGVRSLSKQDEYYKTGENYWRSPVWMPINYLVVSQLKNVATQEGPFQTKARTMFNALRKNLVDTVFKSWKETGFAWEQYNPETGAGQRTQHFTGWTSLVVKIMAMEELVETVGGGGGHDEL
ncbi:glycoside hydrolase [Emericellopsis atlantica]|uniref:Mannosyl-oligosaccharide glucosidase n=1 Tax=Emericellopsis atlantica TaxID=2614577 RepID=A0A9P7ZHS0_9HYPO|nr:glycoside hydrolase [Emericellopsis atlantica]KAG9252324.1 glycoside hydrolase [Emericellopsis atlantica]